LEKALESYQREKQIQQDKELEKYVKVIERKKFSHPHETFTCDKCGIKFQNETAYAYSSRLGKKSKTYCGECI
jgi:hypothetical protein